MFRRPPGGGVNGSITHHRQLVKGSSVIQWAVRMHRLHPRSGHKHDSQQQNVAGERGGPDRDLGQHGEFCLILPPSERTCRRLSQDVASRKTLPNRKVISAKSA